MNDHQKVYLNEYEIKNLILALNKSLNPKRLVISQNSGSGIGPNTEIYITEENDGIEVVYLETITDYNTW